MPKTMTLRLDDAQAATLELIARADDQPMTEAVREAIDKHIEERRADAAFQERLTKLLDEDRKIFERLAR
ncbi:MAG: hypothetical protein QOI62_3955 [Solirubrobacteraceae bacterium]|jgi:predicted transcriptional regulator|nr:hypothetical protein [Solirubrobacteraceae bacterium]